MIREMREFEGIVCSGLGDGAKFTQLDWVMNEFRAKLGFVPHPGTFNLQVGGETWDSVRPRLMREAGIGVTPVNGFCAAKCFTVIVNDKVRGAAVFPEVAGYPEDKFEIIAPVAVRQALGLRNGDRVKVRVEIRRPIEGIVFDIDGSVVRGDRPIPGAPKTLAELRRLGLRLAFFTNDNQRPVSFWVERFGGMGIAVDAREILTSSIIAAKVTRELHPGKRILAIGDAGLREAMEAEGANLIDLDRAMEADAVVIGKDPNFSQRALDIVCRAIWNGAGFIATNYDAKVPSNDGFVPASGPMVKAIAYATGKEPLIAGKPSRWAAEMAMKALGVAPERGAVVGDQLEHDILMGKEAGLFTVAVLTGVMTAEAAAAAPAPLRPDLVLPNLNYLLEWLENRE